MRVLKLKFDDTKLQIENGNTDITIQNENNTESYELTCTAVKCAPAPIFYWMIGILNKKKIIF